VAAYAPRCQPCHLGLDATEVWRRGQPQLEQRARGSQHGMAKLTEEAVRAIRAAWTGRRGQLAELARQYGVWPGTIEFVVKKQTWTHVA